MRAQRPIATGCVALVAPIALLLLPVSRAGAETPCSAVVTGGLVSVSHRDGSSVPGGTTLGVWIDLLRAALPNWSVGSEVGYSGLPGSYGVSAYVGAPNGTSRSMFSASGVVRWRNEGPVRVHLLGTIGYYDLAARTGYDEGRSDEVEHDRRAGFSLSIGFSGSGPVMPGFRLRWQDVVGPDRDLNAVSLEAGLHFN